MVNLEQSCCNIRPSKRKTEFSCLFNFFSSYPLPWLLTYLWWKTDKKILATKGCKRSDKGDATDDGCGFGGKCQMVNDKPKCVCHASYTGKFCETKIDICSEIEKPSHQFHNLKCQYGQCKHFVQSRFGFRCICNGKDGMISRRTSVSAV